MMKFAGCMVFLLLLYGCSIEPREILYGQDKCIYCTMTIMDQRFGCEVVTAKGKVFKFDAVECMVQHINSGQYGDEDLKHILTNTYDEPAKLKDVHDCVFLQSRNMPSPMGMFLNPVSTFDKAAELHKKHGGEILKWGALKIKLAQF